LGVDGAIFAVRWLQNNLAFARYAGNVMDGAGVFCSHELLQRPPAPLSPYPQSRLVQCITLPHQALAPKDTSAFLLWVEETEITLHLHAMLHISEGISS
jgi:hypothetical protein